jgi:RNase P subunit RPR2
VRSTVYTYSQKESAIIRRFICPHCHTAVAAHTMERAWSDLAEYRICPTCDEPIFFAARDTSESTAWSCDAGARDAPPPAHVVGTKTLIARGTS